MKTVMRIGGSLNSNQGMPGKRSAKRALALSSAVMALPVGAMFTAIASAPQSAHAVTTYTWTASDTTGAWNSSSTSTDWKSATYPNAAGVIAQYTSGTGATSLNVNATVGELYCSGGSGASWNISGASNSITLDGTGFASNNIFGDSNSAIYMGSGANTFIVNANLLLANTDLDIGSNNTGGADSIQIGATSATTVLNSGTALRTINIKDGDKSGNNNYNVQFYSSIGTFGGAIAINDVSATGNVAFDGAIGSSVTTVTINQAAGRTFFGNTGNAFTGNLTIGATSDLTLEQRYDSTVSGQVIPYGANAGNVINNGTIDLEGNSQQINGLSGTGNINISNWDGTVGAINDTLTVGNNNASATYSGTIGVGDYSSSRAIYLTKVGTGTQIFNKSGDTITGAITISGGTLQIGDGTNATASLGANAFTDNANLAYDYNGPVTVTNVTTGSGSVTQLGSAPLTLNAANTFSGGLNISSSSVLAGSSAGSLGSGTVTMAASTTLDLNGNSQSTGLLSSTATSAIVTNNGSANAILTISGSTSQTFAGVLQDGTTNSFGLTKSGTVTQTLTGISTYSGATTINAGTLALSSTAGLGNTAITVASGATFAPHPGSGTINIGSNAAGTAGAVLNLNPGTGSDVGATLSLADGAIGVVNLNQQASFAATALTLGGSGSSTNAPILDFDLSSSAVDELVVATGSVSVGSTSALVEVTPLPGTTSLTTGNYTIISAPGGGLTPLMLSANSIVLGSNSYSLTLANSTSTAEILTIATNNTTPINAYWTGNNGTSWSSNAINWATDHTGATPTAGIPGGGTNVYMTADSASASNLSTTLDGAFNINSLSFTGTGTTAATISVTVAAGSGGSLTLSATNAFNNSANTMTYAAGTGIVVQAGSAAHTISAPVILAASQTWEIDNSPSNPLTVSGVISDGGLGYSLTKTGVGTLILTSSNTYGAATGTTYVTGGTLVGGTVGAIPAGTSLVVNGGSFDLDGNNQSIANLSDGGVSTGSIIDSGGAATLNTSSSITTAFSGTINASNATLVVNGTGTANLSGVNSLASLVQNAGVINLSAANTIANTTVNVGTLTVSSTGSITGTGSVIIGDNGNMTVNGGSITAANFYTNSNGVSSTLLTGGAKLNLSGGLYIDNDNKSDQGLFQLSGGSIAATSILIGRTGFNGGTAAVLTAAPVNDGFYITSGTVNDSGTLDLGTNNVANSNAILRMDGGTLNVSGATIITDAGNNRLSTLDVNGGTFTTPSVQIGGNAGAAVGEAGELLVRGTGLANVGTITFGNSAQTVGPNVLELLGGTLYVGSGGIVNGGGSVTPTFNLGGTAYTTAPILAASAAWSSSVGITLTNSSNGTAPTIQAANSSGGAENITLTGGIGGAGGLIKTGAGTLYLAGAGNYYTGITTVNQGVLNINSEYALGGAVYGGLAFNGGTLQYANPLLNATTDVTFNGSGAVPVTIGAGGATIDTNGNSITFVDPIGNNGSGGLTVTDSVGTGVLTLLGTNTYHGATTINSGATLQLGDGVAGQDGTILTSSSIVDNGTLVYNRSGSLTSSVSITGSGSVVISGAGTQTLTGINQYTGGTNVSAGELVLASGSAFPAGVSNAGTGLIVAVGATLQIASHGSAVAFVPYVSSLNNSGTIDITNNGLVVRNGSIGTISSEVAAAYNNSAWNGTSGSIGIITSSTAAGDTTHLTAVGVATGLTSFEGATVSTSDVLVKYTYYGDANLDGHVDGTDYSRIDNGYLLGLTGWSNGDFNYDGVINGSDYTLIDNSYNTQGAALAAEIGGSTAVATAQIAGGGASAVPEPATFGLLGIGTVGLLGRRRRGTR